MSEAAKNEEKQPFAVSEPIAVRNNLMEVSEPSLGRAPTPVSVFKRLRRECRNSPAWVICSAFAFWLIAELRTGLLFAGMFGLAFGGLGVAIDRWRRYNRQ